ncbi:MAG TPA: permease-like cell division protein FtsX [Gemmatimonadaceae bacterium]|nr:permease-like cell division protein FtsX [Gemmatimonadaceae bacterium]
MRRTVRDASQAFERSPVLTALSVTTIAFSLFAFGLFGLVALNIRAALQRVEERVEIRAFVADGTDAEAIAAAAGDIAAFPEVLRVDIVSKEDALARARRELSEFSDVFEAGVLPASIDIQLKPGFRDPSSVQSVAERLHSYPFVDDVRYGEEWLVQLYRLRNIAGVAGFALGLAFAAVAIIIIGATIRMAVLARAEEISIMRLVGATDGYIRRPFLLEGFVKGVMGGLLALLLAWLSMHLVDRYLNFDTVFFPPALAALGVAAGALIGVVGSGAAVGRHLRRL